MGIFNFKKIKTENRIKPQIWLEADNIIYNDGRGNEDEIINLKTLSYVNVTLLGETPYLLFFSECQYYVSTESIGFKNVYNLLSEKLKFNNSAFLEVCNQKHNITKRIWIKPQNTNYYFLETNYLDFNKGFEVLCNPNKFISWDTTIEEITTMQIGNYYVDEFNYAYFKLNFPIRLGSMIIENIMLYNQGNRKGIGIQNYYTNLYHQELSDKSYIEIKQHWNNIIPINIEENGYERADQNNITFYLTPNNDVYFSIIYSYNFDGCNDDGSTIFHIVNNKDYSDLISNKELENNLEITDFILLNSDAKLQANYRTNEFVVKSPSVVLEKLQNKSMIWFDKKANLIGFSDNEISLVYNINEISHFKIQNILAARGPGYSQFIIELKNADINYAFYEETYAFDYLAKTIENWTNLKVKIAPEYYND